MLDGVYGEDMSARLVNGRTNSHGRRWHPPPMPRHEYRKALRSQSFGQRCRADSNRRIEVLQFCQNICNQLHVFATDCGREPWQKMAFAYSCTCFDLFAATPSQNLPTPKNEKGPDSPGPLLGIKLGGLYQPEVRFPLKVFKATQFWLETPAVCERRIGRSVRKALAIQVQRPC